MLYTLNIYNFCQLYLNKAESHPLSLSKFLFQTINKGFNPLRALGSIPLASHSLYPIATMVDGIDGIGEHLINM